MPHDKNGTELKAGDRVTIECEVESVQPGEEYCNLTLRSVEKRKPDGLREMYSTNAAVVVKAALVMLCLALFGLRASAASDPPPVKCPAECDCAATQFVQYADAADPPPIERRVSDLERRVKALEAARQKAPVVYPHPIPQQMPAPAVAAPVPFGPDQFTTPDTPVPTVVEPSTYRPAQVQYAAVTYTAVPRVTSGGTSGCSGAGCNTSVGRRRLFGWR